MKRSRDIGDIAAKIINAHQLATHNSRDIEADTAGRSKSCVAIK